MSPAAASTAITVALGAEFAGADPPSFEAVTRTRIVWSTSAEPRWYCVPVAPGMSTHATPAESQRSHWKAKLIG